MLALCEGEASLIVPLSTSKSIEILGAPAPLLVPLALLGQFQCVLQPTGALQYVGIRRVAVALTAHLNAAESVRVVHISLTLPLRRQRREINLFVPRNVRAIVRCCAARKKKSLQALNRHNILWRQPHEAAMMDEVQ